LVLSAVCVCLSDNNYCLRCRLPCDGQTLQATAYPLLAAALGQTGTFTVPDLQGVTVFSFSVGPIGLGTKMCLGRSILPRDITSSVLQVGGLEKVPLNDSHLPRHSHSLRAASASLSDVLSLIPGTTTLVSSEKEREREQHCGFNNLTPILFDRHIEFIVAFTWYPLWSS
jgi:microcystin-dependent protein